MNLLQTLFSEILKTIRSAACFIKVLPAKASSVLTSKNKKSVRLPREDDPIAYRYYINLNLSIQDNNFYFQKLKSWLPDGVVEVGAGFVEIPFQNYKEVETLMRRSRIHYRRLNAIYSNPIKELLETRKAHILYWCVVSSTVMSAITTILFIIRFLMGI